MDIKKKIIIVSNLMIILGVVPLLTFFLNTLYIYVKHNNLGGTLTNLSPDLSFLLMIFLGKEIRKLNPNAIKFTILLSSIYLIIGSASFIFTMFFMPYFFKVFFVESIYSGILVCSIYAIYIIVPLVCLLFLAGSKNKEDFINLHNKETHQAGEK